MSFTCLLPLSRCQGVYRFVCRDFTHQSFAGKSKARQNGGVKKTSKLEDLVNVHHFSGRAGPARAPPPLLLLPLPTDWLGLSQAKKSTEFLHVKGKNCPGGLFAKNGSHSILEIEASNCLRGNGAKGTLSQRCASLGTSPSNRAVCTPPEALSSHGRWGGTLP